MLRALVVATFILGCHGAPPPAATAAAPRPLDDSSPRGRLDDRARPVRYALELTIDPAAPGFSGRITIDVALARPAKVVWLHARALSIDHVQITAGGVVRAARVASDQRTDHVDGQAELVGLATEDVMPAGPARIEVAYRGTYGETAGLIKTRTEPAFVYSDLEPTDARAMMPCFDEPVHKTPWQVSLVVPSRLLAAGNSPELRRAAVDALHTRIELAPTRPLPSYLVAVAVGELVATPVPGASLPVRILTPPGLEPMTAVASAAIPGLIDSLARLLDEPLPLDKLDVLAIPAQDGASKGMENPGLITLVPNVLLADPAAPAAAARRAREDIVHGLAHELAHQWFGNLITVGDWSALWLQEGGASWLGARAARELLGPTWIPPFHLEQLDRRLVDGARAPISMPIRAASDPAAMFRIETYAGGAAIFAALEAWLGPARVRDGLRRLIDVHRDGNFDVPTMIDAFAQGGPPELAVELREAIATMTSATRMPTVTITPACADDRIALEVTVDAPEPLAVCADLDGGRRGCGLIRGTGTIAVDATSCPRWVLSNPGGGAPYRRAWPTGALAAVLAASHPPADELALFLELRSRMLDGAGAQPLAPIDLLAASAFVAATGLGAPMIAAMAIDEIVRLWQAAPDDPARKRVVAAVVRQSGTRPLGFIEGDRAAATAPLARWLAVHGDARARAAAAKAAPDLIAALTDKNPLPRDGLIARAATGTARQFDELRRRALAGTLPWASHAALGAFQLPDIVARLRTLLAHPKLANGAARQILDVAAQNPATWPRLAELIAAARGLTERDLAELAGKSCDERGGAALLPGAGEVTARARTAIARCLAVRAAWPADL